MPRLRRNRGSIDLLRAAPLALALAAIFACTGAQATQADRDQPVNVNANSFAGSQESGKTTFTGNVKIDQGTLHADGDNAVGYFDQNNQVQRVVLTGTPAHMQQKLDDGSMVHGAANTIDYTVSQNTVVLTGNANVVQEGKGSFHGEKLTYNTDSGQISGESGGGGQVHLTLQPKPKPAKAAPAKAASAPAAGASIAAPPASTTMPPPTVPAPASTTHNR
ncbi:MAG TPA: lipopolysaccharide transport periplasmic protein LptA [Rhodanobacteraceae bacterium]|nr:lipopolysaccharide transport periplasmic protein LptA [Rhodanobacteraceae bacterium]